MFLIYVPCLFFVLHVRIHFRCERCDMCVWLIIICWEWPYSIEFAGGFIMFLWEVKTNAVKAIYQGYQRLGISRLVQAKNTLTYWRWPPSYPRRPWKSRKLLFQNPNTDHRNWAKINTSLRCSKFGCSSSRCRFTLGRVMSLQIRYFAFNVTQIH